MSPATRVASIVGGILVVVAAGIGGYALRPVSPGAGPSSGAPLAMPPDASPAALPAPAPDAAEQARQATLEAETVAFVSSTKPYTLLRDSAVYVAASKLAPQMYTLRAGASVMSTNVSKDGAWVIALTQDGQAAYLLSADLGPYVPPAAMEAADRIEGPATLVDTGTLQVAGQQIALSGVHGLDGIYAERMQKLVDEQGGHLSCATRHHGYVCTLPNGADLARVALYNGAADPADDASPDYRQQADAAREAHRGRWQ